MKKLAKSVVVYLGPKQIEAYAVASMPRGACCGKCALLTMPPVTECSILAEPDSRVSPFGVCALFVGGKPTLTTHIAALSKEDAAYTIGPTRCGNCEYIRHPAGVPAGSAVCELVLGDIEPGGCCNAWSPVKVHV